MRREGADDVLFVGERARAAQVARALEDRSVQWADSPAAARALVDGRRRPLGCVVTDDRGLHRVVAERWTETAHVVDEGDEPAAALGDRIAASVDAEAPDYPVPETESARLDDLEPYLREAVVDADSFDRLAALACRLLEGTAGFVGLLDRHRWHRVGQTGDVPETIDRGDSLCSHTVLEEGPLVVADVARDERFPDAAVEDYGVRAYAGVPVRGRRGEPIGTLCVVDAMPRAFADDDVDRLAELAVEVGDQFELRRRLADERAVEA